MKQVNRKAAFYAAYGVTGVLAAALITDFLAPENSFGRTLRFIVPLLAGVVAGTAIFFKLKKMLPVDL